MALRERIAADIKAVMDSDAIIKNRLILTAQIPNPGGPDEFAKSIEEQRAVLAQSAKDLACRRRSNFQTRQAGPGWCAFLSAIATASEMGNIGAKGRATPRPDTQGPVLRPARKRDDG